MKSILALAFSFVLVANPLVVKSETRDSRVQEDGALQNLTSVQKVIEALKANEIIMKAAEVVKQSVGAQFCTYSVEYVMAAEGFEIGTTYDYSATISCGTTTRFGAQSDGFVRVKGRMFSGRIDAFNMSVDFAG